MLRWRLSDEPIAADEHDDLKDPEARSKVRCKIFLGYTSNLISSGLRETLRVPAAELRALCLPLLHAAAAAAGTGTGTPRCAIVGIAGAAGSGKSTLASLLSALGNALADADAADAGSGGGLEDLLGTDEVGSVHRTVVGQPECVTGGGVEDPVAAVHVAGEGVGFVGDIAFDGLAGGPFESALVGSRAEQGADRVAARDQFVDEVGTNETGGAGDEALHGVGERRVRIPVRGRRRRRRRRP
jgi:hypothetical protein